MGRCSRIQGIRGNTRAWRLCLLCLEEQPVQQIAFRTPSGRRDWAWAGREGRVCAEDGRMAIAGAAVCSRCGAVLARGGPTASVLGRGRAPAYDVVLVIQCPFACKTAGHVLLPLSSDISSSNQTLVERVRAGAVARINEGARTTMFSTCVSGYGKFIVS